MNDSPTEKNNRDFFLVVKLSSAIGMGSMAAFLYSLKQVHPDIRFELGIGTVIVFLGAAVFSWLLCGLLAREGTVDPSRLPDAAILRRRKFVRGSVVAFMVACALGTVVAFGASLKNVSSQSRRDVIEGTVVAGLVLAVGGWLIRKAYRFFEEHSEAELQQLRDEREDDEP